jgi:hypothetical protein
MRGEAIRDFHQSLNDHRFTCVFKTFPRTCFAHYTKLDTSLLQYAIPMCIVPRRQTRKYNATCHRDYSARCLISFHHHRHLLSPLKYFQRLESAPMAPKIDPAPWTNVLGVLAEVAKAVPVLGAPIGGSVEALTQIQQYTKVGGFV